MTVETTPLRILYAVHSYKPAYRVGGPVISVSEAAEMLVRKGHKVTVFSSNSNLDEDLDVPTDQPVDLEGVEVWYFSRKEYIKRWLPFLSYLSKSMGYLYAPKLAKRLGQIVPKIDLVHTHMPFVYPTYAASRAAFRFCKPLFYNQRGVFDPNRLKFRSLKKRIYINAIERPIMQRATTLIALTDAEVNSYRNLGVRTPCTIIPNGIKVAAYRQQNDPALQLRWNILPQSLVILFLGRLHPIKGVNNLIEAFLRIRRRFPEALLILAGPDEFGLERQFEDVVRKEGANKSIVFSGMVSGIDKLELLARADLFCLPSKGEGFSMAALEALASATPVLLSPECNFAEVEVARAGKIVKSDPAKLAEALVDLLSRPKAMKAMGEKGREFVLRKYSWDHITDQLLEVYFEGIERYKKTKL